jgi:energy-coupling factor transport system permease protein
LRQPLVRLPFLFVVGTMKFSKNRDAIRVSPAAQGSTVVAGLPHPAVLILLWAFLVVAMQVQGATALLATGLPLMVVAAILCSGQLAMLLQRTRWIMASLLLIYAYVTPGEPLWIGAGMVSPTREGLSEGLLQLARLAFSLTGLSIVLHLLSLSELIGGVYALTHPLRYVGVSPERIAVRLALTLHYVESALREVDSDWRACLDKTLEVAHVELAWVEVAVKPLTLRDGLLLATGGALLTLVLL